MTSVDFSMFVDRPGVMARVNKKRSRVLARTGGYGRTTMKRQMRPAGKKGTSSKPGEAPKKRVGTLRDRIYFGIDDEESLVIGPTAQKVPKGHELLGGLETVAQLLNEGGREILLFPNGERVTAYYEPRPFTEPVRPTIEQFFQQTTKETPL